MRKKHLQDYLDKRRSVLSELDHPQELHEALQKNQRLYLALLADQNAHISHRAAAFTTLVQNHNIAADSILEKLKQCRGHEMLMILEVLTKYKMNGRRARQLGLKALFGHVELPGIAAKRRLRIRRLLKHLLGERTWTAVIRALVKVTGKHTKLIDDSFLKQAVLRFADDQESAIEVLKFVAGFGFPPTASEKSKAAKRWLVVPWLESETGSNLEFNPRHPELARSLKARFEFQSGQGLPRATLAGIRGTYFPDLPIREFRKISPRFTASLEAGTLTTLLKKLIAAQPLDDFQSTRLPFALSSVDVRVGIVLDMSGSMASSGSRLYHPAALAQSIVQVMNGYVSELSVVQVGGESCRDHGGLEQVVRPAGQADLAMAVLEAASQRPDVIFVVTDGYDNARQGDVDTMVQGLKSLDSQVTIYQVIPVFTMADDISTRQLGADIPAIPVCHESATGELLARAHLAGSSDELNEQEIDVFCQLALNHSQP